MLVAYTMIGASDLQKSWAFYDAVLRVLGAERNVQYSGDKRTWYQAPGMPAGMLAVGAPFEGEASGGNGAMVALMARDTATVDAAHAKALELGATDEGAPGLRGPGWYGAYFRDFDGNKIALFTLVRG
jgi:catechol 2,3-dioxygenase-like lactoylglutathione lyase family enzyme